VVEPDVPVVVPLLEPAVPVVLAPVPVVLAPVLPVDPGDASPFGALLSPVSAAATAGAAATDNPRNAATANSLARFRVFAELLR
jgi:hypothetical protein